MQHHRVAPALTLTILGVVTPYPRPDQACSGYLVTSPTARVWVEAGSGSLAVLQRFVELDQLDALWFSHMHPDHTGDLPALANWLLNRSKSQPPLPVYGPPGWMNRLTAFLPTRPELLQKHVITHELYDGHVATIGDLQLISRAVRHTVETYGLRIEAGSHVLAYSGDTGPCPELRELANHADVFLCEVGASMHSSDGEPAHCTPEDAAQAAQHANVRHLLITHIAPTLDAAAALGRAVGIHSETALALPGSIHEV